MAQSILKAGQDAILRTRTNFEESLMAVSQTATPRPGPFEISDEGLDQDLNQLVVFYMSNMSSLANVNSATLITQFQIIRQLARLNANIEKLVEQLPVPAEDEGGAAETA